MTIQNGQLNVSNDFFAGTGLFYINTSNGHVGINDTNPIATLELGSGNVAAANVGYATGEPLIVAHYDGPRPFESDFTGNPHGHLGQNASISGGVIFRPGKFGKAVQVAEATTNLMSTNPSFESGTVGLRPNSWNNGSAVINTSSSYYLYGSYSGKLTGNVYNNAYSNSFTLSASTQYTASAWVYVVSGTVQLQLSDSVDLAQSSQNITTQGVWTRVSANLTTDAHTTWYIYLWTQAAGTVVYVDGIQVEQKSYTTPYADGSLGTGHSWYGTAHASNSSRTAANLAYASAGNIQATAGTVSFWLKRVGNNAAIQYLLETRSAATSDLYIYDNAGTLNFNGLSGGSINSLDNWYHVAVTWDGTKRTYVNGVQATSAVAAVTVGTSGYLGRDWATSFQGNFLIDDLATFDRALSAEEIYTIYKSNAPVVTEAQPFDIAASGGNLLLASSGGNVGIGTTGPGAKLDVRGGNTRIGDFSYSSLIRIGATTYSTSGGQVQIGGWGSDDTFYPVLTVNTNTGGTNALNVGIGNSSPAHDLVIQSGASLSVINAGATQFTASSSRDIKENIKPIKVGGILDRISAIPVNTFDFRNSSCSGAIDQCRNKLGLIAEDFYTVFGRGSDKYIDGQDVQMALWLSVQELNKKRIEKEKQIEQMSAEKDAKIRELQAQNALLKGIVCKHYPEEKMCRYADSAE